MNEESKKILEMLSQGKISVLEAEKLLEAIKGSSTPSSEVSASSKDTPNYLRVKVKSKDGDNVNIRVPLKLVRAVIKLKSLIPDNAQVKIDEELKRKGLNFSMNDITKDNMEELLAALSEFQVDVQSHDGDIVEVFCE
jgi:hypothetical protein